MKVSIIVPVYNVEEYLDECVQSIISQTFSNIEIVLVDDGSTDSSGMICDCWAEKDKRITVVHKQNAGLSSARNTGIELAQGKYIIFVDSDDCWIGEKSLSQLYDIAESHDADVVRGEYILIGDNTEHICAINKDKREIVDKLLDSSSFFINVIDGENYIPLFLYLTKSIKRFRFDEKVKFLEDADFNIKYYSIPHRCVYIDVIFYCYRKRASSILTTPRISNLQGMLDLSNVYEEYANIVHDLRLRREFLNKSIMYYYWTLEELTKEVYYKNKRQVVQEINLHTYYAKTIKKAKRERLWGMPLIYIILPPLVSIWIIRLRNRLKRKTLLG